MGLFDKALAAQQEQTPEETELATHVRKKVEEVRASANRIAHESIWMTNIAYLMGMDGITFNSSSRQFQPINRASNYLKQNRIHVNKILPTVQNRLARLCKSPPKYDVKPESNSNDDKEAARLSLQVLQTMWESLTLDKKRLFLYMWVQQCGHAYMKISWDPTLGNFMVNPQTGEPGFEGDVRADIVSPFEIFPDPMAKTDDDLFSSWLIQAKVRKLDYFRAHYPEKGANVKQEDAWLLSAQYEQRINSINSRGPSASGMSEAMKDSAIELIKYEARSAEYPNGRMIVVANGQLLENKELPTGMIPFAMFDDVIVGGKLYPESIITGLRPLQDQYNELIRRRSEWTKKLLAGKYKAPRGSAIAQESLNDESGEVLYEDPVPNAPQGLQPLQVPMIPQWAYKEEEALIQMFNDHSGTTEVDRGNLPAPNMPALGMQIMVEQSDTRTGVITEQHEHAWARVGQLILKHIQKFYVMPRKLKIAGKNLQYTVKEVSGDDLKNNTDVLVIRGSTLPGSKALRRQEILNTYSQGILGDPNDPKVREKVLGMIEFGDVAEMWEDYGLDMSQIKRGMEKLEAGEPVPASEFDNHALWIQELNRYRKGDKWESLDPAIQALILSTMEDHIQAIMKLSGAVPPMPAPPPGPMAPGTDPNSGQPIQPPVAPAGGPPQ